jgi:MFS family permease
MTSATENPSVSSATAPINRRGRVATLMLAGTLTVMAGATVAPAIPGIRASFAGTANVDLFSRLIITTPALAIVVFSPLAGILVDRVGRRTVLVIGMLAFAIGGSSGAYLPDLATILAGRVVLGAGVSMVMTSSVAMIADLYTGVDRQRLLARQQAVTAFGGVVFLLGGGLLAGLDWRVVFLIYLLSVALVVPALLLLPRTHVAAVKADVPQAKPRRGLSIVALAPLVATLLGQVAFYAVPVQIPFLVEEHFHARPFATGVVIAIMTFTVGMVALGFAKVRGRAGEHTLVALSFLGIGLGCLVLFLAPNLVVLVTGLLIMGAGLGILMPNVSNWIVTVAPPLVRGRYVGFLTTSLFLGQFLSPLVTQPLVDAVGIQPTFAVIAAATLLIAAGYMLAGRRPANR